MRQLARLSEARVERLAWLPRALLFASIRFEQVSASIAQNDGAIMRAEGGRTQQTLLFEVPLGLASVVAPVMEIALGDDAKSADGGEYSAFSPIDLVHAIALSHWPTLTAPWQIEVLGEHVARLAIGYPIAFAAPAAAADAAVPKVGDVSPSARSRVVSLKHFSLLTVTVR